MDEPLCSIMLAFTLVLAGLIVKHTIPAAPPPSLFHPLAYFCVVWVGVVVFYLLILLLIEFVAAVIGTVLRLLLPS